MGLFHSHHSHDHDDHHGHPHSHPIKHGKGASRSIQKAIAVTLLFMIVEIIGGFYSNSLALISDGVHMAMDAGALFVSLLTLWLAARPAHDHYTYGYQRVEILGALLNGLMIWLISGFLVWESFERFSSPPDVRSGWVIGIGSIGLVANLLSLKFLHGSHHENLNVRSAYLHVLTDCLGSVAAILAGVIIQYTGWTIADPILTCLFSVLMLWGAWRLVRESVDVLMERSPHGIELEKIERSLKSIGGVAELHDLHVWTLSSGSIALSVHLQKKPNDASITEAQILSHANETLSHDFGITHSTIQIESDPDARCDHCG